MNSKIQLRVSNKQAYVWDVKDIAALRSEHRVCGLLAGTLPRMPQQNVFLGVPLLLIPEEVVLLMENELAVIVDDRFAHHDPSAAQKSAWQAAQEREKQIELEQKERAVHAAAEKKASTKEAATRRLEREQRRAAQQATTPAPCEPTEETSIELQRPDSVTNPESAAHASSKTPSTVTAYTVKIPAASTEFSWYSPAQHSYSSLGAARDAQIWTYPETPSERARCGVYRSLWQKGYYMGCGIKFGGDFLVYPGDPLRYHSHFVATVLESDSTPLRPMEIIAHGRLGTATKKAHLLCAWNEQKQEADVFSIEWAGFG